MGESGEGRGGLFFMVGYLSVYRAFYRRGAREHTGGSEYNPFWVVEYLQRSSYLRGMSQANVDLGVFQETKFTKGIYPRELGGYQVVVPKSPSLHSSGITMFYLKSDHFTVSAIRLRVTNVVRFQLTLGGQ